MNLAYVKAMVERDAATHIAVHVPEYEIPVLKAIHGDTFVVVGAKDKRVVEWDADKAFDVLTNKYRTALLQVYRDASELDRAVRGQKVQA